MPGFLHLFHRDSNGLSFREAQVQVDGDDGMLMVRRKMMVVMVMTVVVVMVVMVVMVMVVVMMVVMVMMVMVMVVMAMIMMIGVVDVALLTPPLGGGHFARALSHSDQPRDRKSTRLNSSH